MRKQQLGIPLVENGYFDKVLKYQPVAYWPLWEASGTAARNEIGSGMNGTYNSDVSGWPVGTGIGDGNSAPGFDGTNDYVDVYSSGFNSAFDGQLGSVIAWFKVSGAGVWTDGVSHEVLHFGVDGNNFIILRKTNANNAFGFYYEANNVQEGVTHTMSPTTWQHIALTWSLAADAVKAYLNGAQVGTTQSTLGTWAGNLSNASTLLGAYSKVPANAWSGNIAHVAVFDYVLPLTSVADLAVL